MQRGFTDVSMQQIAEQASITKATLYHHFKDKQDLYLATMRRAFTQNYDSFFEKLGEEADLPDMIQAMLAFIINTKSADMQQLMSDFRHHIDEETQQRFWDEFPKPWVALEPIVQREVASGAIIDCDPEFVAKYVYGAVAGYAHVLKMTNDDIEPDDNLLSRFASTVLNGIIR